MRLRSLQGLPVAIAAALLALCCSPVKEDDMSDTKPTSDANPALARRVEEAVEACRRGDLAPSSALVEEGAAAIPLLASHLSDPAPEVREQVVAVLGAIGGREAIPPLLRALGDEVPRIRERAALRLYADCDPASLEAAPGAGEALRRSVAAGNESAAALLLLGRFPGEESVALLRAARDRRPPAQTELQAWTPVVPAALPARVALSRLGEGEDRRALLESVAEMDAEGLRFLLLVLGEIDAPELLHELSRTLDDATEIPGGVPSGAEPSRRLCDLAVDAFVGRLDLEVGFPLNDAARYSEEQVEEVRAALEGGIPR